MINNVRNTVLSIINKANNGYVTPDQFNQFAKQAQLDIFEEYFTSYAEAMQKVNAHIYGTGHADIMKRCEEVIDSFTVPAAALAFSSGFFSLPTDRYKIEQPILNGSTPIDEVSHNKILQLLQSNLTTPTTMFPVYTVSGGNIKVYPTTIISGVTLNYTRYPLEPKWTYVVVTGSDAPLFNPAAVDYQDFELPLSDEMNLIIRILEMAGVSIREEQVVQMAKSEEIQDKQEQ